MVSMYCCARCGKTFKADNHCGIIVSKPTNSIREADLLTPSIYKQSPAVADMNQEVWKKDGERKESLALHA